MRPGNLRGSLAWDRVQARLALGAAAVFASAGAIAVGRLRAARVRDLQGGHDLHWQDGLDLLRPVRPVARLRSALEQQRRRARSWTQAAASWGSERFARCARCCRAEVSVVGLDEHTGADRSTWPAGEGRGAGPGARDRGPRQTRRHCSGTARRSRSDRAGAVPARRPARHRRPSASPRRCCGSRGRRSRRRSRSRGSARARRANGRQPATQRDWARADQLRTKIEALGWQVQDTADGPRVAPGVHSAMIWDFQDALTRRLLLWSAVSIAGRRRPARLPATVLARLRPAGARLGRDRRGHCALRPASANKRLLKACSTEARAAASAAEREARNLRRLLWINTGLDVLYVAGGADPGEHARAGATSLPGATGGASSSRARFCSCSTCSTR